MSMRMNSARISLYLISGICIIIGFIYLSGKGLMPYHINFLGKSENDLDQKVLELLIYAKRIIGGLVLSIGGIVGIITWNIQSAPRWLIYSLIWLSAVPLAVTGFIAVQVGAILPIIGVTILTIMTAAGIFLAAD